MTDDTGAEPTLQGRRYCWCRQLQQQQPLPHAAAVVAVVVDDAAAVGGVAAAVADGSCCNALHGSAPPTGKCYRRP